MPELFFTEPTLGVPDFEFKTAIAPHVLLLHPRHIANRSGQRVRGPFPSRKTRPFGPRAYYESLVEKGVLTVLEVSRLVDWHATQPYVLILKDSQGKLRYTPDVLVSSRGRKFFIEIKGEYWLRESKSQTQIRRRMHALKTAGIPICLFAESDIPKASDFDQLEELLRDRPAVLRKRGPIDIHEWDPLDRTDPDAETLRRWRQAQKMCDELLVRVMRRDPDDLLVSC